MDEYLVVKAAVDIAVKRGSFLIVQLTAEGGLAFPPKPAAPAAPKDAEPAPRKRGRPRKGTARRAKPKRKVSKQEVTQQRHSRIIEILRHGGRDGLRTDEILARMDLNARSADRQKTTSQIRRMVKDGEIARAPGQEGKRFARWHLPQ